MKTSIAAIVFVVVASSGVCADAPVILARVHTPPWVLSLEVSDFDKRFDNNCILDLVAAQHRRSFRTSLKPSDEGAGDLACSLFGPISIVASSSSDYSKSLVIVEAARGGDGDHSGPIIQVFELGSGGFRKIGEQELFDAMYERQRGEITGIIGNPFFDFCNTCDGPSITGTKEDILVPVKITIGKFLFRPIPTINKSQRKELLERFRSRKGIELAEMKGLDKVVYDEYKQYVKTLERDLLDLLSR